MTMTDVNANCRAADAPAPSDIIAAGQNLLWSIEMLLDGRPVSNFTSGAIEDWKRVKARAEGGEV